MTQKILALSGKKQAGKNTSANWLLGYTMVEYGIIRSFDIGEKGELIISDIFGNRDFSGEFDPNLNTPDMVNFLKNHVHPHIKLYSFADLLKQNICIDVLGLTYEQCYGTDDEKQTMTKIKWEDIPGVITKKPIDLAWSLTSGYTEEKQTAEMIAGRLGPYYEKIGCLIYHEPGYMTAREVMQVVGTDIFRKM